MFGKHFESMYSGSMRGAGAINFAVWGYVISHMKPDKGRMVVELNAEVVAFLLGEAVGDVLASLEYLMDPDPKSRSKEHGGRRMLKIGEYLYEVVNGMKYRDMKKQQDRREQNRQAQARYRAKHLKMSRPTPQETAYVHAVENGATDEQAMEAAGQ